MLQVHEPRDMQPTILSYLLHRFYIQSCSIFQVHDLPYRALPRHCQNSRYPDGEAFKLADHFKRNSIAEIIQVAVHYCLSII